MALRILPCPPGHVPPVAMRAQVGSEYPSLPLHGATFWLGMLFMFLRSVTGDISACSERNTNHMRRRRVCTCIYL